MTRRILLRERNDENGRVTSTRKEDQSKGVGMGFMEGITRASWPVP